MFALHNSRIVSGRQSAAPDDATLSLLSGGQAIKMPKLVPGVKEISSPPDVQHQPLDGHFALRMRGLREGG